MVAIDDALKQSIVDGLTFLQKQQSNNGEFANYMANTDDMQDKVIPEAAVFSTSLIAACLLELKSDSKAAEILSKATRFLLYEMVKGNLWSHYTKALGYFYLLGPDMDNTVCASLVLKELGYQSITDVNLPVVKANRNNKGRFYTWFAFRLRYNPNETYWRVALNKLRHPIDYYMLWKRMSCDQYDVDGVVNANALYYLGDIPAAQPIISYLIEIIKDNKESTCDKWYHNHIVIYYFISRNYYKGIIKLDPAKEPIIERTLTFQKSNGKFGESHLETALAIITLLNLNYDASLLKENISYLLAGQQSDGSWPRWVLFYGGPEKLAGWGSEELTTAFCVEAITRYKNLS